MKIIDKYLFELQNHESVFPMDSIHTGQLPSKKVMYGDSVFGDEDNEEDESDDDI